MSEPLWTDERISQEFDKRVWKSRYASGSEAEQICHEIRDELQAYMAELQTELADAMGECIEFTISYGIGDEDRFRARYRELTGRNYGDD